MKHPIELDTRVRYEIVQHAPNGCEQRVIEQGEATILSSLYDGKDLPLWKYRVSPSGEPVLMDTYPFEKSPDEITIWQNNITEYFDEIFQKWLPI